MLSNPMKKVRFIIMSYMYVLVRPPEDREPFCTHFTFLMMSINVHVQYVYCLDQLP